MNNSHQAVSTERIINMQVYRSIDYSGFFERLFARWIDFFLEAGLGYLIYMRQGLFAAVAAALIFDLAHRIVMTYFFGGTVGKLLFGVRVISRCSKKLTIWQVLIREISKLTSHAVLNIGFLCVMFSRRKRALHDIIACTAVTSGGKSEAEYAMGVYSERPERWNPVIWGTITAALTVSIIAAVTYGASYILNDMGMIGFSLENNSSIGQYSYKLTDAEPGAAAMNKNIIQVGDIDGNGKYQIFRECIKDGKTAIISMRSSGFGFTDGDIVYTSDKPIVQYRLVDINGDKKDELAVLFTDRSLKIYKLEGGISEIGSLGPIEYKQINAFVKGEAVAGAPYNLYIVCSGNKLSVVSFKDGKFLEQKYELPGQYNITGLGCGTFLGKYSLAALSDTNKVIFYSLSGNKYTEVRNISIPIKGKVSMAVHDIDMDGTQEIIFFSSEDGKNTSQVLAAYKVSGSGMKMVWNGGRRYRFGNTHITLTMDDGMIIGGSFRAYMVSRKVSGTGGSLSLLAFDSDRILMKANEILSALSYLNPVR